MGEPEDPGQSQSEGPPPWPQQLMDSIWVLALAAVLFFVLSYVVWGFVDLLTIPMR